MLEIGKPLHMRLAVAPMALFKLNDKPLLDGVRTYPSP
jgi:hypothetical protein